MESFSQTERRTRLKLDRGTTHVVQSCLPNMATKFRLPGGDLEYAVLSKLWELGSASAREIYTRVGEPQGLVYTTTAKVLDRLHAKGLVSRERRGTSFIYRPRVARDLVDNARAREFLKRLFGPAPRGAGATLVDAVESLDPALLDELAEAIAARRRIKHGP
jgi:BlaI family transcriptional regulator, penicillinase repressor